MTVLRLRLSPVGETMFPPRFLLLERGDRLPRVVDTGFFPSIGARNPR